MYVHIGQDYLIPTRNIVSIMDMDTATNAKSTRQTLSRLEQEGSVIAVFEDLPKSAILCIDALGEILYLSQLSSKVLQKRANAGIYSNLL